MNAQVVGIEPVESKAGSAGRAGWVWKPSRLAKLAVIVVAVLVFGAIANAIVASRYTPGAAVSNYLNGIMGGDPGLAWDQIQVMAPTQVMSANLTDMAALRAALAAGHPDVHGFDITGTTFLDSSQTQARVDFSYVSGSGTKQAHFDLLRAAAQAHYGVYPVWKVLISPTLFSLDVPAAVAKVSIDGTQVALPAGVTSTIAVLPLTHRVVFSGTAMLQSQTITVSAFDSIAERILFHPELTPEGKASANKAIADAFAACAQQTAPQPNGCPQAYQDPIVSSAQWQLTGDPTQGLNVAFDQSSKLVADGHFQMVIAFTEGGTNGVQHDISAGGFVAGLTLGESEVTVQSLASATGLPALQRPAGATDEAARAQVSKGLSGCVGATVMRQADCPQALISAFGENVRWKLKGNPLAGASVAFDPATGILTVHGQLDMTATYTINGYRTSDPSFYNAYDAHLLWDGQALQLITIRGALS